MSSFSWSTKTGKKADQYLFANGPRPDSVQSWKGFCWRVLTQEQQVVAALGNHCQYKSPLIQRILLLYHVYQPRPLRRAPWEDSSSPPLLLSSRWCQAHPGSWKHRDDENHDDNLPYHHDAIREFYTISYSRWIIESKMSKIIKITRWCLLPGNWWERRHALWFQTRCGRSWRCRPWTPPTGWPSGIWGGRWWWWRWRISTGWARC